MWLVLLLTPKWHRESSFSHLSRCWTCCVQRFWWGYWWDESHRFVKSWKKILFFSRFPPISFTSLTGVTTWWNLYLYIDILTFVTVLHLHSCWHGIQLPEDACPNHPDPQRSWTDHCRCAFALSAYFYITQGLMWLLLLYSFSDFAAATCYTHTHTHTSMSS